MTASDRGVGSTSEQIKAAPVGAIFVHPSPEYVRQLASKYERGDLEIIGPMGLESPERYLGTHITGLIVDHAIKLTTKQQRGLDRLKPYVGRV
jgi:hypothetical protein